MKYIALVVLLGTVLGMAHLIEGKARPDTGRQGQVQGGHAGHGH
jgi:hypothetical protein